MDIVGRQGTEEQLPGSAADDRRPPRKGSLGAFALATCLLFPAALANPFPPDLSVEYAGCREVLWPGRGCLVKPGDLLRLWIQGGSGEVAPEIRIGGRVVGAEQRALSDGRLFSVKVPEGATWLSLRTQAARRPRHWFLPLRLVAPLPAWVNEAADLSTSGRFPEAASLLDRQIPTADLANLGWALRRRADISPSIPGDPTKLDLLRRAVDARRRAGQLLSQFKDAAMLAWVLIDQGRFAEARQCLNGLHPPAGSPAKATYEVTFNRGLLAQGTGDFRQALIEFQAAQSVAARVGLEREEWLASEALAIQESTLGRFQEARDLFESLKRKPPAILGPYDVGDLLTNYAWSLYRSREAGEEAEDPTANFAAAAEIFAGPACPDPVRRFNAGLNLALAHLQSHRQHEAKAALAAAAPYFSAATPSLRFWSLDLQGRLSLEEGRKSEALAIYGRLDRLANGAFSPEDHWRATFGKAAAYDALGDRTAAIAALAEAEKLVDAQLARIPIQEGRESFVDLWERGSRLYVDLLLRAGQSQQALLVARRARARVLRQLAAAHRPNELGAAQQAARDQALSEYLEERRRLDREVEEDAQLAPAAGSPLPAGRTERLQALQRLLDRALLAPADTRAPQDNLPPPRAGELILAYFPLPQGWVGFAADADGVDVNSFPTLPDGANPARQAEVLLQPFQKKIDRARRLRILPYGKLRAVEFHALPWDGSALLAAKPVAYGLDLGLKEAARSSSPPRALIVSDPRSNLPVARREADEVESALSFWHPRWSVERLQGAEATREAVLRHLTHNTLDLFHYAGHARFSGRGGWDSALLLGRGSRFTLGDVLTLDPAPRWVVLFGCETGREDLETQVESQGLAQAFLLAGSQAVIASTQKIHDSVGRRLAAALYREASSFADPATLVQLALLAEQHRLPQKEWTSFRVFEP